MSTYIKTLLSFMIITALFCSSAYAKSPVEIANEQGVYIGEQYAPHGTMVIAARNGQILYADRPNIKWPPASMSKLMTIYLVYQAMEQGKFSKNTKVKVNDKFYAISQLPMLSNNHMRLGASYTVDELLQTALTDSSNVATYILASLVDKDDTAFIDKMNQKAKTLRMTHTHYYNPVGAPNNLLLQYKAKGYPEDDDNISSAKDYAILTQHLISEFPDILKYTKKVEVTIKKGTQDEETFHTYNHSLEGAKLGYKGVDGLKTGSSDTAGFNTTITGHKNNMRIILTMMGVMDWYDPPAEFNRNIMANAIMDEIYGRYSYQKVLAKGKHQFGDQEVYVAKDLYDIVDKKQKGTFKYENGIVQYDYKRQFVDSNDKPATVTYEDYNRYAMKKFFKDHFGWIIGLTTLSILSGLALLIYSFMPKKKKTS
ncbi:DUF1958 domain-containing protein [Macrococcus brunensis]|uniref:DUF1958 domain-containing protein n=1 Tax=Macrococcus brunensis TaxID=198483 RepID=UPI001EF0F09E|nr:DUF1958 domain-containing protein [Macrococcus brunensis]ULG74364.1 DUF1958 domain-containing protein [Macrococcus brunensis]